MPSNYIIVKYSMIFDLIFSGGDLSAQVRACIDALLAHGYVQAFAPVARRRMQACALVAR